MKPTMTRNNIPSCGADGEEGLRVIEFFSGIGGMRLGVEKALANISSKKTPRRDIGTYSSGSVNRDSNRYRRGLKECHAYEISLYANATYRQNFHCSAAAYVSRNKNTKSSNSPLFSVTTKLIEQLKSSDVDGQADMWTMSPPCQPFTGTTNSKRLDGNDKRTAGFRAVMTLLDTIQSKPRYILLENVKGFVGSQMLDEFYGCLKRNGYSWQEYLLTPIQFGIPNHRKRYYLTAERSDRFIFDRKKDSLEKGNILEALPNSTVEDGAKRLLSDFINHKMSQEELQPYVIPDNVFAKPWAKSLPIVSAQDTLSHCFTAAYGRVVHQATGSLLLTDLKHRAVEHYPLDRDDMMKFSGRLRRFTPEELLALFGYPPSFVFPADISLEHRYKLIGNSVNCFVVSRVAEELLASL